MVTISLILMRIIKTKQKEVLLIIIVMKMKSHSRLKTIINTILINSKLSLINLTEYQIIKD